MKISPKLYVQDNSPGVLWRLVLLTVSICVCFMKRFQEKWVQWYVKTLMEFVVKC